MNIWVTSLPHMHIMQTEINQKEIQNKKLINICYKQNNTTNENVLLMEKREKRRK